MYCPPRGFGYSLCLCSPTGCCRLLLAIPSPQGAADPGCLRFPVPGENANRGVAGFDCFPGCCRQLLPLLLQISAIGNKRRWSKFSD